MHYVQIIPDTSDALPHLSNFKPFKAVVVIDQQPTKEQQHLISRWLVESGCLYMMAWGENCSSWDDSVDWAVLEKFDFKDAPDDQLVMTTWHEKDALQDVFEFCKTLAVHETVKLDNTLVIHIGSENKKTTFESLYEST